MLQLSVAQHEALLQVAQQRLLRRLCAHLAQQWPAMAARLGERLPEFVERAVLRAQTHGLFDGLIVARYANLWFVFGSSFEDRPEHAWAAAILGDPTGPERAKAHQLSLRARDELARTAAAGGPGPQAFVHSEAQLASALPQLGRLGDLAPCDPPRLDQACDLSAIDITAADTAGRLIYTWSQGQWLRRPPPGAGARVRIDTPGTSLPPLLAVLAGPPGAAPAAKLDLRLTMQACCDDGVHPRLLLATAQAAHEWRGREAARVMLPFACEAAARPGAIAPPLAAEDTPQRQALTMQTCGVRSEGAAIAEAHCEIAVVPSQQWLLAWRTDAPAPLRLSTSGDAPASPPIAAPALRLERDGTAIEASAWREGLQNLQRSLQEAWPRLLVAFEREAGVTEGTLTADCHLLGGEFGLAWGWTESEAGFAGAPFMRIESLARGVACAASLQLEGLLDLDGARARLRLAVDGQVPMSTHRVRNQAQMPLGEWVAGTAVSFRLPVTLDVQALADASARLMQQAEPASGVLAGACGLRAVDGSAGVQLFASLRIEPAACRLRIVDPLLGFEERSHPLLPAMTLLDWSLG